MVSSVQLPSCIFCVRPLRCGIPFFFPLLQLGAEFREFLPGGAINICVVDRYPAADGVGIHTLWLQTQQRNSPLMTSNEGLFVSRRRKIELGKQIAYLLLF
jgi:hypothetical protein